MEERNQYLDHLIEAAKSGNGEALQELSSFALGGNQNAQAAVQVIDKKVQRSDSAIKPRIVNPIVWPEEVQSGQRGPQLGDIPLHNDP